MRASPIGRICRTRCAIWPDSDEYATCPICGTLTRRFKGAKPISELRAKSLVRHAEFEEFYSKIWLKDVSSHVAKNVLES